MKLGKLKSITIFTLFFFIFLNPASSDQVTLNITVTKNSAESHSLKVENSGDGTAKDIQIYQKLPLLDKEQKIYSSTQLAPQFSIDVNYLPLITDNDYLITVSYMHAGSRLSAMHLVTDKSVIRLPQIKGDRFIELLVPFASDKLKLLLPDDLLLRAKVERKGESIYLLESLTNEYQRIRNIYILEQNEKSSRIYQLQVDTDRQKSTNILFSRGLFLIIAIAAYLISLFTWLRSKNNNGIIAKTISRACFSLFIVSSIYTFFLSFQQIFPFLYPIIFQYLSALNLLGDSFWYVASTLLKAVALQGKNYNYFLQYIALPLFIYFLTINFFVNYFLIIPYLKEDKHLELMKVFFFQLADRGLAVKGALSILVKTFYIPLLTTWSVQNIFYITDRFNNIPLNFLEISSFLISIMILIDVGIFTVGYLTELPQLKNQIRSVDKTFLGWFVCIVCYPPFNEIFFAFFDRPLLDHGATIGAVGSIVGTILIVILWAIYLWASIALGFKASNLTNRGIVYKGPYKYIRHPAYAAKVCLWGIECGILGARNLPLFLIFLAIYFLRALTEERHLSLDPEYKEYQDKVKYRFIPLLV